MSRLLISNFVALSCAVCALPTLRAQQPAAPEAAAPSASEAIAGEVRAVFEKCKKAVVKILAFDRHGQLSGTGFFIDPNGTLFTSYTIGGEARDIYVEYEGVKYPARRIVADPRSGVAILKVDARTPFLMAAHGQPLRIAEPVVTVGFPMDLPLTPGFGTIGGFDIKYLGRYFATTHIRANVPVQRGEGGAPLLNMHGEVLGILISSLDSGSASFVLPIAAAEKVHKDFLRFGELHPGWIGINVVATAEAAGGSHAQVDATTAGGPAEKAGLQKGDVLIQIGDKRISAIEDILDGSFFLTADQEVAVKVFRESREVELTLRPTAYPGRDPAQLQGLQTHLTE